jgi:hypothetical protein
MHCMRIRLALLLIVALATNGFTASLSLAQSGPVPGQMPPQTAGQMPGQTQQPSAPAVPTNAARALLANKDVVLIREFSPPISLDTKNSTSVEVAAYVLEIDGEPSSKLKGLRIKIKYDNRGYYERVAYLDMDEAMAFSSALSSLAKLSTNWLEAKRKGNAESEFLTKDGFAVGFTVDNNGDHQGYFAIESQKVYFVMSQTIMSAVKGHIDKLLTDLKKV